MWELGYVVHLNAMFVALGDRLASYGAANITVKDEDWQKIFYRLASLRSSLRQRSFKIFLASRTFS
jgi:hypothetical protein